MTEPRPASAGMEFFGAALEPALRRGCDDRLEPIHWFRTDWQRGGALTGYSTWLTDEHRRVPVVVKMPVPPVELAWMRRLQPDRHGCGQVTPLLLATGEAIGGYDLAWIVMERLTHGPLDHAWGGAEIDLLADAAVRFYRAASQHPVDQPARVENWPALLKRSREAVRQCQLSDGQRWNAALKSMQKKLDKMLGAWDARDARHWCHGDLHLANLMTHAPPPGGPAMIFDLAMIHAGHWLEDAVYFEHLFWSRPQRLAGRDAVKLIAHGRRACGLSVTENWAPLANIRRCMLASIAPIQQVEQANPHQLHACLVMLEKLLTGG
jgi:hypothetical protein